MICYVFMDIFKVSWCYYWWNLTWEAHIEYIESKLLSAITMIKWIRKFVPKTLHKELYFFFISITSYTCYFSTGRSLLKNWKSVLYPKRCIRLLFGTITSFDHPEFYETCARIRPYISKIAKEQKIMSLRTPNHYLMIIKFWLFIICIFTHFNWSI